MNKIYFNIIIFIINYSFLNAQCPDYKRLIPGNNTEIGPFSNETLVLNYKLEKNKDNECCHISKIENYSNIIISSAKEYIIKRGGENFYNNIKLITFKVIYHDFTKIDDFPYVQFELNNCGKITYWLTYNYKPNEEIDYSFSIELNSNGKIISNHTFPDYNMNINFENFITVCQALEVAKNQKAVNISPVFSIELSYLETENTFCWLITEDFRPQLKKEKGVNVREAKSGYIEINEIYVDANFGYIVKYSKKHGAVTN